MVFVGFLSAAALIGACGGTDDDGGAPVPVEPDDQDEPAEEAGGTADDEASAPDVDSETTVTPDQLTASFRGVTPDRIRIGVVAPDLESVRDFVDLDHGSYEAAYAALIADVNATGGVNGRALEMVFEQYLPIGTEGMDTVCARMTEDEQVFAVLGGLLDDGPLCYTAFGDTALVGSTQNDRRVGESSAPWFTGVRNTDDVVDVVIRGFDDRGIFDDATVGVVALAADRAEAEGLALPLLTELGVDVADVAFIAAPATDTVAAEREAQVISQRQQSEGVDLVLAIGGGVAQYAAGIEDSSYRPRIATTSLGALRIFVRDRSGRDLGVLEDAVAGNTAEQLGWWDDPQIQECIDIVEAAGEPPIFDPNTRAPDEAENIVSVAAACRDIRLFVAIATAAGPDLTNESFGTAGRTLGEFDIPGFGPGFYDSETPDGGAPVFFYEWDETAQDLRTDGSTL